MKILFSIPSLPKALVVGLDDAQHCMTVIDNVVDMECKINALICKFDNQEYPEIIRKNAIILEDDVDIPYPVSVFTLDLLLESYIEMINSLTACSENTELQ
jgi:hypothetical protein